MKEQILQKIESFRDYAIEMQRGLTAIPAIAPSSGGEGEHDKAKWLDGELRKRLSIGVAKAEVPEAPAGGAAEAKEAVRGRRG